ncbi:hypothetical protein PUH89_13650 [Rhodobacter capsulatus]|uniref:hypothetical protein n=1 Tax=Rhodobacter capsulatus TaxID=1061 RepID=UPI0011141168|nr:hypothetical protein [Rhodobacter capsulatus]WER08356.1 hypothetical protein PUH89_13650 [Rhodobacter capsulatus]
MISKTIIICGDAMDVIFRGLDGDIRSGKTRFSIGATGCIFGFASSADLLLFRLALPISWTKVCAHNLSVAFADDPPFVRAVVDPIIERLSLRNRVMVAEFAEIFLPTEDDHDRLLWAIQGLNYSACFA